MTRKPKPPTEAEYAAKFAQDKKRNALRTLPLNDGHFSSLFGDHCGEDFRYIERTGFIVWDGRRWAPDPDRVRMKGKVCAFVKTAAAAAEEIKDKEERTAQRKVVMKYGNGPKVAAAVDLVASNVPDIVISKGVVNKRPMLFNVQNGTIDLTTGDLRPPARGDLLTKIAPVTFDANATCPTWRAGIRAMCSSADGIPQPELESLLQRIVGYCLTGRDDEKVSFFFIGEKDTGKTTWQNAITDLIGPEEYCTVSSADAFMKRGRSVNSEGRIVRSECIDIRLVFCSEVAAGSELDDEIFKSSQGGETIRARGMYAHALKYRPEFKIIFLTNVLPAVDPGDPAAQDRIFIVPLVHVFRGAEKQSTFTMRQKLQAEMPGILNWAIEGCLAWQRRGLDAESVPCVVAAKQKYLRDIDPIRKALLARYEFSPRDEDGARDLSWEAGAGLLQADHLAECAKQNLPVSSVKAVGAWLRSQGCSDGMAGPEDARYAVWKGLRRREDAPDPAVGL